jgi:hypothetical protein
MPLNLFRSSAPSGRKFICPPKPICFAKPSNAAAAAAAVEKNPTDLKNSALKRPSDCSVTPT